jgi:hypothetical protein
MLGSTGTEKVEHVIHTASVSNRKVGDAHLILKAAQGFRLSTSPVTFWALTFYFSLGMLQVSCKSRSSSDRFLPGPKVNTLVLAEGHLAAKTGGCKESSRAWLKSRLLCKTKVAAGACSM